MAREETGSARGTILQKGLLTSSFYERMESREGFESEIDFQILRS